MSTLLVICSSSNICCFRQFFSPLFTCSQIEEEVTSEIVAWKQHKPVVTPTKKTELVHQEPKPLHEDHDVGEDKFALLQKLMKNLSQL